MHTGDDYNLHFFQVLEDAGFIQVKAEDRTDLFIQSLKNELVKFETIKEEFVQVICQ